MVNWKQEAVFTANRFIAEMDEPDRYETCTTTNGQRHWLNIYDKVACDTKLTLGAATYRELYLAVQFAWNVHVMANRGF